MEQSHTPSIIAMDDQSVQVLSRCEGEATSQKVMVTADYKTNTFCTSSERKQSLSRGAQYKLNATELPNQRTRLRTIRRNTLPPSLAFLGPPTSAIN